MKKAFFLSLGWHLLVILFLSVYGFGATPPVRQHGIASWYGPGFYGNQTANQEIFNHEKLTAAHKELPFNTYVRVKRLDTGHAIIVRINDRGPFIQGRIIDLSEAAARGIDMIEIGIAPVVVEVIDFPRPQEGLRRPLK